MKKLILILAVTVISCNPQDDLPQPEPTITPEPTIVVQNPYNFEGVYKCDNWTLSAFGHIGIAQIEMYGQEETFVRFNLIRNSNQQFSGEYAVIDSNYFDVGHAGVSIRYRGNLIHEDTLRVTEYAYDVIGQTKNFIRQ
jgi:hypothetical protein